MNQWVMGPPTKPGLVVIEWMNAGGLAVYMVVKRLDGLYYLDTDLSYPNRDGVPIKNWSVRCHYYIGQIPHDPINPCHAHYTEDYDAEREGFHEVLNRQDAQIHAEFTCANCGHYPLFFPPASHDPTNN